MMTIPLRPTAPVVFTLLSVLAAPACSSAESAVQDARTGAAGTTQSFTLSGDRVAVYNLAGNAEVVGSSGTDVVVEVTTAGADAGQLGVEVDRIDGREALRIMYPSDEIHYARARGWSRVDVDVRSDGTFERSGWSLFGWGDGTRISTTGGDLEAWADVRILVPADRDVAVRVGMGEAVIHDLSASADVRVIRGDVDAQRVQGSLGADTGSGSISVAEVVGDVSLDTGSGSVRVSSIEGSALIDTGSGSVEVAGIRGDRLDVDTGSGSVTLSGVSVVRMEVDTGSGGVRMEGLTARDVHVDTGSGSVRGELLTDVEHMDLDTGSGGVVLDLPVDFGAELDIDTGSGGIEVDLPVRVESRDRNELRGTVGDGRGTVRIETGSGSVRIRATT